MTQDVREELTEWLTGADSAFLFGAGCSVCAGKPLIGRLTDDVMSQMDEKLRGIFQSLVTTGGRAPTIEDLITYLLRYRDILKSISDSGEHSLSVAEIDAWLSAIKGQIVQDIADPWTPNEYHARFLRRTRNPSRKKPRDVFSLNYDTVIEASLDQVRLPYVDGFRGTNRAWFDADTYDEMTAAAPEFRLYKLHGSINWTRDDEGFVRRSPVLKGEETDDPIVVYPSEQKYIQTQYGVYKTLMGRFRDRLRAPGVNNRLIVFGYSFNDEHINEAICDAITARGSNLTVMAFVGPEAEPDKQEARLKALAERCDDRFNVFVGEGRDGVFIGNAVDQEEARIVLDLGLWRFENLVDFIAGAGE